MKFGRYISAILPGLGMTAVLLALHVLHPQAIAELGNLTFDAYQRAAPRPYEAVPVRIVDIDDETIARFGQWPWPRTDVARMTQAIADAGASSIAFDIVFSEPDRTSPSRMAALLRRNPQARGDYAEIAALPDHDVLFARTLANTPSIAGYFLTPQANTARPPEKAGFAVSGSSPLASLVEFHGAVAPLPVLSNAAKGAGSVSTTGNTDSIVRQTPLIARVGDQIMPSLSLEALRVAQGAGAIMIKSTDGSGEISGGRVGVTAIRVGDFTVPTTPSGDIWMYYTRPAPERIVPAWKILSGALSAAEMARLFDGNIVFVGAGAIGLRDTISTPLSPRELGVAVHAQAAEQMILGKFLVKPDWGVGLERVLIALLGLMITLAMPRLGALKGGVLAVAVFAASAAGSWISFRYAGLLIDPTYPALTVTFVYMTATLISFYREERARSYIHKAFDRFLSPELVARIARDPGLLELGGEERDMTVMFCDVRGFSRISEGLKPKEIIGFLIEFLTPMTEILLGRKATVDKYIGDAIVAFWNAPLDDPDHPRNAARAALAMVEKLKAMNAANPGDPERVWPGEVKIGIGLNTGLCCVGNMGSAQRLSYSLIGDTVNLAARIEGLTKTYGAPIAVGCEMAGRISDFALVEMDLVRVVGRDMPETLYALIGDEKVATTEAFQRLSAAQTAMLTAYRDRDWKVARSLLAKVAAAAPPFGLDSLVAIYTRRIARYVRTPPGPDWDGVYQATEK